MVWLKMHDGADLDEDVQGLRRDPFDSRPKMVRLADDYVAALEAKLLRYSMLLYASRESTDGVITSAVLPMIAANAQLVPQRVGPALDRLCSSGLLRKRPARAGGGYEIRNFLKYNPSREQVQRAGEKTSNHDWLHKSVNGKAVKARIVARDGNWCRYCGTELQAGGDRRSTKRRTFDFVDPGISLDKRPGAPPEALEAAFAGIVLACGYCNSHKGERTPDEAGMTLRAAPSAGPTKSVRDPFGPTGFRTDSEAGTDLFGSGADRARDGSGAGGDPEHSDDRA